MNLLLNTCDNLTYIFRIMNSDLETMILTEPKGLVRWDMCGLIYAKQIITALVYLHEHGIIHNDIKTKNCLTRGEICKLTGFGKCKKIEAGDEDEGSYEVSESASPEQWLGKHVGPPSDIFRYSS